LTPDEGLIDEIRRVAAFVATGFSGNAPYV